MTIRDLVNKALKTSDKFYEKYHWWVIKRGKLPTLEWLMPLLEDALGEDYVRAAAREEAEKQLN